MTLVSVFLPLLWKIDGIPFSRALPDQAPATTNILGVIQEMENICLSSYFVTLLFKLKKKKKNRGEIFMSDSVINTT